MDCENVAKFYQGVIIVNHFVYNGLCSLKDGLQVYLCPSVSGEERVLKGDQVFDVW